MLLLFDLAKHISLSFYTHVITLYKPRVVGGDVIITQEILSMVSEVERELDFTGEIESSISFILERD